MSDSDRRLTALEEKILFQEDALAALDAVVRKQYDLIDLLTRRVRALEDKAKYLETELQNLPDTGADVNLSPSEIALRDKPPHY